MYALRKETPEVTFLSSAGHSIRRVCSVGGPVVAPRWPPGGPQAPTGPVAERKSITSSSTLLSLQPLLSASIG